MAISLGSIKKLIPSWNDITFKPITLSGYGINTIQETKISLAASNIDLSAGGIFVKTITAATTFTVSNIPASGVASSFILELTNAGGSTITWWSAIKWPSGLAPSLTAVGKDILGFYTHDNGTTWNGFILGYNVK